MGRYVEYFAIVERCVAKSVQGVCFTQVHRAQLTFEPEGWNNMPVAVKTILLEEGSGDRVKQEVAILERTSNLPNVVGYYKCDYILTNWAHHIVMELMEVRIQTSGEHE